jgi:hypothetical protein
MWDGALRELFAAGVRPTEFATLDITPPAAVEIIPSIGTVAPGVASLLFRNELQGILCNLKVLIGLLRKTLFARELKQNHL